MAAEAVNSKITDWRSSELIAGYQMRSFMKITVQCQSQSLNLQNRVSIFFYFYWLSFYRSVKLDYRKIRVTYYVKGRHKKNILKKVIAHTVLFHIYQWMFWPNFMENRQIYIPY